MEGLYSDLKKRVQSQPPDEPGITTFLAKIEAKQNWFKKAEGRQTHNTLLINISFTISNIILFRTHANRLTVLGLGVTLP